MIKHLQRYYVRTSCILLRRYEGTFVSKYFNVDQKEIRDVLENMSSRYRRANGHYEVQVCNLCDKGNKQKEDNLWKLYVHDDGRYHCFRCSKGGSWFDLKRRVANGEVMNSSNIKISTMEPPRSVPPIVIEHEKVALMARQLYIPEEGPQEVLHYLINVRGLTQITLLR